MKDVRPRRTRMVWATGLAAAGLTTGLLAAAPAQSATGDQVADDTDQYTVKVHVAGGTDNERACSGTLVDQQWVLTAASCFAADPQQATALTKGVPPLPAVVTADGNKPTAAAQRNQKVQEIVPYPGRDLVLARFNPVSADDALGGPFPDISSAQLSDATPVQGDQLRAVGYGRTKQEWTPERAHTGSFGVDLVNPTTLAISPGAAGAALCKGDAGGPVLNTSGEVVGVVSAAWDGGCLNSSETRTGAVATRVDDIADWVQQVRLTSRQKHITNALTAADFDGDGRTDIAALMDNSSAQLFRGRPDGTLQFGNFMSVLGRPTQKQLIAGDFLDDSKGMEVIAVGKDGNLSLAKQRVIWGRFPSSLWEHRQLWTDAAWKDALPVAALRTGTAGRDTLLFQWPDGSLYTYKRDANGDLVNQKKSMWPDKTWKKKLIATADFTGDGRDDIAAVAADGALHLYTGKADGTFDKARSMWPDKTWGGMRVVLGGDFNGDGKADLAALTTAGDLRLYVGDGKGVLAASKTMWPKV
ncbi:FG-GAP-like repeat-containing protein [Streptomyces sp. NRRL B-24085]|uniref:FG-GAP-like repeat-containing protein n=1 Tax=Streptomyces sp. NRRL B-24085 TaxID=1709476 RepID=UPI00117CD908|nr:FG-GAP-like repeat-containing protein [Streptomyces sp. NRRL B-24085]